MGIGLDWGNNMQLAECLIKCGNGGGGGRAHGAEEYIGSLGREGNSLFATNSSYNCSWDRSKQGDALLAESEHCIACMYLTDQRKIRQHR